MNKRQNAVISGISLLLMAIIAGFSIGYAYSTLYNPEQLELLKNVILQNAELYRNMLIGILFILILDLLVSYTLYKFFEDDNRKISFISGAIRVIYTIIFGIATFHLTKNLHANEITNEAISQNFQNFQLIWNSGLIIFGVHIFLIGMLMKSHKKIPQILCWLTFIAGISYAAVHLLKLVNPNSEIVKSIEMILVLPMAIGELGLAIWLLLKGGRETRINNETSANI